MQCSITSVCDVTSLIVITQNARTALSCSLWSSEKILYSYVNVVVMRIRETHIQVRSLPWAWPHRIDHNWSFVAPLCVTLTFLLQLVSFLTKAGVGIDELRLSGSSLTELDLARWRPSFCRSAHGMFWPLLQKGVAS